MVRKSVKITVCTMAAVMAFSGMNITADAAASSSVLPSGGIELTLAKGNKLESLSAGTNNTKQIESIIETVLRDDQMDTTPEASEEESFKNLVIAQVNDYVNVRSMPSEQGEIVGKLYDDSVGLFISEENGWYQISSGSVTGYVKAEYCVTGDEAVELAKKVGTRLATVNTTTLKVRTEPSLEASVLGLVPLEDDLVVSDETDGWVQVDTEEGLGWVSTEFVSLHTEFVEAESKEEEAKRLAKEKQEPIYLTQNGDGEMVFVPLDLWEKREKELDLLFMLLQREQSQLAGAKTSTMDEMERLTREVLGAD